MTATTSTSPVRKQAEASIDAVASEIQHAARQELESLRSLMNVHLAALDRVITRDQNDPAFAPILEKLCEVASQQAEAASTSARTEAQAAADRQLAAARAQAQADLDAAHAMNEAMRAELEQRLTKSDAAGAETARALADLRASTAAALLEAQERLAQSEAARLEAALSQAETERVAAAARQEADADAASLAEARATIAALEGVRADLMLGREIAEAHLEGEVHHRNAIAAELDVAQAKAKQAKSDADALRLELQRAAARIRALEAQQPQRAGNSNAAGGDAGAALAQVRSALQRVTTAASGRGLLDAALTSMAENFSRVALCMVGPQGCTVWGSHGFDPPLPNRKALIPTTADSPLTRALADGKTATVRVTDGEGMSGVSGSPIGYAIALPIVVQDQCIGMLYAENPPESSIGDPSVAEKIAEILADHLGLRLRPRGAPPATTAPPQYSQARQASRVKIPEGINVAVDGADSTLVDLSILGAQVLSPRAIRPNRSVQLLLPSDSGALACEARVVWVVAEPGRDRQKLFRAGVQFKDVSAPELEAFFSQHGVFEPVIRH